ncbi:MAG: ABC transporter permease [Tannerella sp.]|jgi:heme/copper-type cytochrome/quinol oxidase subunit 2|nr:ABC transporter permease [Tannerella sp.]
MFNHYLKIAFRNLRKYRSQTHISVIGLATGFACFAMATLWIRYEMTYDNFHENADRIYRVDRNGRSAGGPYPLAGYLKATFPEIGNATPVVSRQFDFEYEEIKHHNADILKIDSSFFSMFAVKLVEGSMDFLIPGSKNLAVSRDRAIKLFGNESPVGKILKRDGENYTVCAVVSGLPKRSNFPFDFLQPSDADMRWNYMQGENTLVEIKSGVDMEAFRKKLYEHSFTKEMVGAIKKLTLTPIISMRYKDPNIKRDVKFQHIIIFAIAGSLLILCTLFNYLTLFVSRFRIRQKELALRTVYGASGRSLLAMLSVEFALSLIMALLLGLFFIQLVMTPFQAVSGVKLELTAIYLESTVYIAAIIVVALTIFLSTLAVFRRRTLNANIRSNKKIFRKMSIAVQLTVSIGFAFCTAVILKQMYHLHNTDLGFAFKNRGSVYVNADYESIQALENKIRQIPEIEETISGYSPLLPMFGMVRYRADKWDGKQKDDKMPDIEIRVLSEQYARYYEIVMLEGEPLSDSDSREDVIINESAAKAFGWNGSAGKSFTAGNRYRVKGVFKNMYSSSPTVAAEPVLYRLPQVWKNQEKEYYENHQSHILFKYNEGSWKTCAAKIGKIVAAEFPDKFPNLTNDEEEYGKFLKSENTLLAILTIVSAVCMIVCVFGFVSIVSLTCEERRKEIAIRKINGATVKDILDIFFKEHLTLLVIGALIAFPIGYIIMKGWMEQYVLQTEISVWIYVSILFAIFMAIVFCVGGQVYKTSRENPIRAITRG